MKNRIFSYILILTLLIVTVGCGSKKQAELNTQNVVETTALITNDKLDALAKADAEGIIESIR